MLTFAGLEDERHALPTRVVNPKRGGGESWAVGIARDGFIIQVPRLAVRGYVLSEERVLVLDRRDGA